MEEKHFIREGPKLKYADIKKQKLKLGVIFQRIILTSLCFIMAVILSTAAF